KIATAVLLALIALGTGATAVTQQPTAEKPLIRQLPAKKEPAARPVAQKKESEALPASVSGVVNAVDADKGTLTVANREGETTFSVAKDARINIDGKEGTLAGVLKGANVTLSRFVDSRTASRVQAAGRWYYGASVKAV